jgi:hypothetical protein
MVRSRLSISVSKRRSIQVFETNLCRGTTDFLEVEPRLVRQKAT